MSKLWKKLSSVCDLVIIITSAVTIIAGKADFTDYWYLYGLLGFSIMDFLRREKNA